MRDPGTESGFARATLVHDYDFRHLKDSTRADIDVNATKLTQSIQITVALATTFISTVALVSSLVSAHNSGEKRSDGGAPEHAAHLGWLDRPLPLFAWNPALTGVVVSSGLLLLLVVFVFDKRARFRTGAQRFISQFGRAVGVTLSGDPAWQLSIDLLVHAAAFLAANVLTYWSIRLLFG